MRYLIATLMVLFMAAPMTAMANEERFEEIDTNNDGFISRDEARAHHDAKFDKKDTNKDGKISKDEMDAYMKDKKGGFWNKDKKEESNR